MSDIEKVPSTNNGQQEFDFDPEALRTKYREERDKRIRADGNEQYVEVKGDFSRYVDDPYVDPGFTREPLNDAVDVVIIGGGFGGLLAGARLREAGVKDIRVIEKGGDFGGTWYWNRYPGAQCDIESYIYLPLLEETGYIPKEKYSYAPEILAHARRIGEHFDLYRNACFQTQIKALTWSEEECRWIVTTNRDDKMSARFVVMSNGPLNRPKLPGIPGIDSFKGHTFHTSRWDYGYTGGDTNGNLHKLGDKRVAVIGTGATAVQCVPFLAKYAKHLYVFQRTPSSIDERGNRPTDPEWVKTLKPGWQKHRMENFNVLVTGGFQDQDLVSDGWTDIIRNLGGLLMARNQNSELSPQEVMRLAEIADFKKMNQIRARVDAIVKDKRTAESLKPWYRQFCKRPTFNDEYLPAFNRPNVTLVDTMGRGVDRITGKGSGVRRGRVRGRTASSSPPDSKWARPTRVARASRFTAAMARRFQRELGERSENTARLLQRRVPELLPYGHHAECFDGELSAHARRAVAAHHRAYPAREIAGGAMYRADRRGRSRVGGDDQREGDEQPGFPGGVYARLLQQ